MVEDRFRILRYISAYTRNTKKKEIGRFCGINSMCEELQNVWHIYLKFDRNSPITIEMKCE